MHVRTSDGNERARLIEATPGREKRKRASTTDSQRAATRTHAGNKKPTKNVYTRKKRESISAVALRRSARASRVMLALEARPMFQRFRVSNGLRRGKMGRKASNPKILQDWTRAERLEGAQGARRRFPRTPAARHPPNPARADRVFPLECTRRRPPPSLPLARSSRAPHRATPRAPPPLASDAWRPPPRVSHPRRPPPRVLRSVSPPRPRARTPARLPPAWRRRRRSPPLRRRPEWVSPR